MGNLVQQTSGGYCAMETRWKSYRQSLDGSKNVYKDG